MASVDSSTPSSIRLNIGRARKMTLAATNGSRRATDLDACSSTGPGNTLLSTLG
jgi:hypothetical protein